MKIGISALLFLFALSFSAFGQTRIFGTVSRVVDGQTVEVATNSRVIVTVRLLGFEAPSEGHEISEIVQQHLEKLLLNKSVRVQITRLDDTGTEGFVYDGERDIALQLLRDGAGWLIVDDVKGEPVRFADYKANENAARQEKRGVWAYPDLIAPSQLASLVQGAKQPFGDSGVAQAAWNSVGAAAEGIFGQEIFSLEQGNCSGQVTKVVDGDTVKVRTASGATQTVRLAAIDAPEKAQEFGAASTNILSSMISGRHVRCSYSKKDRYGRLVGKLDVDGMDINLAMISRCGAVHYKKYSSEQTASEFQAYDQAENNAKGARCGFWGTSFVTPEDFRSQRFLSLYQGGGIFTGGSRNGNLGSFSSGATNGGGSVQVRGYTRRDGTYVAPHTRSAPSSRRK